jgi:hypothetical protein
MSSSTLNPNPKRDLITLSYRWCLGNPQRGPKNKPRSGSFLSFHLRLLEADAKFQFQFFPAV